MKRIQRTRKKGYKSPPNSRYCGRPTKWGNPFKDFGESVYFHAGYRWTILDPWVYFGLISRYGNSAKVFRDLLMDPFAYEVEPEIRKHFQLIRDTHRDLESFDSLSCFCPLGKPCHVDALIELLDSK